MQEKITTWTSQLKEVTQQFQKEFGHLFEEELNWKPDAATWSVAQNLDHLITLNETYFPVIHQLKEGTYFLPWLGRFSMATRFLGNFILSSVSPMRTKKIKTFPLWEPKTNNIDGAILDRFVAHQQELIALIQSSKRLLEQQAVISSPANRNIVYTLERAFDIIISHEQRHLNQARETWALSGAK